MKILFAGGGTAGHINPALAVAAAVRAHQPDAEIPLRGRQRRHGGAPLPEAGYDFRGSPSPFFSAN